MVTKRKTCKKTIKKIVKKTARKSKGNWYFGEKEYKHKIRVPSKRIQARNKNVNNRMFKKEQREREKNPMRNVVD